MRPDILHSRKENLKRSRFLLLFVLLLYASIINFIDPDQDDDGIDDGVSIMEIKDRVRHGRQS